MCAGKSSYLLVRDSERDSRTAVSSSSAAYRVLRGVRQRASRSVDREIVGRNASEAIELRHKLWFVSAEAVYKVEGNTSFGRKKAHRSPSARHVIKADRGTQEIHRQAMSDHQVGSQELIFKGTMWPTTEVRWFRSSEEVR